MEELGRVAVAVFREAVPESLDRTESPSHFWSTQTPS